MSAEAQNAHIKLQFYRRLSPDNQMEVQRLGMDRSIEDLVRTLDEIERYKAQQLLGQQYFQTQPQQNISISEIEKIVNERMQSLQKPQQMPIQQSPVKTQASYTISGTTIYLTDVKDSYTFKDYKNLGKYMAEQLKANTDGGLNDLATLFCQDYTDHRMLM